MILKSNGKLYINRVGNGTPNVEAEAPIKVTLLVQWWLPIVILAATKILPMNLKFQTMQMYVGQPAATTQLSP